MSRQTQYCSFCGKADNEVMCLIAGPTVFTCNECVELFNDIVFEHRVVRAVRRLMPDQEIKSPNTKGRPLSEFVAEVKAEIAERDQ